MLVVALVQADVLQELSPRAQHIMRLMQMHVSIVALVQEPALQVQFQRANEFAHSQMTGLPDRLWRNPDYYSAPFSIDEEIVLMQSVF